MAHCEPAGHAGAVSPVAVDAKRVILAGNPNVGKSAVFNALTGTYVTVSNFPGTTVDVLRGGFDGRELIDTPGVYGVSSFNDEEIVARDVIVAADVVINVVDAVHLERDLFLTLQLIDMGLPMVLALNMVDEARKQGVSIDVDLLEDILGIPIVQTVAVEGKGIDELRASVERARPGHWSHAYESELLEAAARVGSRSRALLVLEGDLDTAARAGVEPGTMRDEIYRERRSRVNDVVGHVVSHTVTGAGFVTKLSHAMMHPATGIPMLLAVLWATYKVLGEFVAGTIVGLLEESLMQAYWEPAVRSVIGSVLAEASGAYRILAGEFGVLTLTPTYLVGVILPLVAGFYLIMSLLEDSGYLPRIAAMTDRALEGVGLNGRAVIPLILGFGCVTMGTLTTRILGSRRERVIATTLMAIAVPCSAQIAVIAALMGQVGVAYSLGYIGAIFVVFVAVGTALSRLIPGAPTDLLIDLPPLRVPRAANVFRKTGVKVYHFMKEVTVFFLAGALLISVLDVTGGLDWVQKVSEPLIVSWLHLPAEAATAFVMGFVRRDFGATGFFLMDLTSLQLLVGMVTITLFVPCIASVMVIMKERGWAYLASLLAASIGVAFLAGGLLTRVLEVLS